MSFIFVLDEAVLFQLVRESICN